METTTTDCDKGPTGPLDPSVSDVAEASMDRRSGAGAGGGASGGAAGAAVPPPTHASSQPTVLLSGKPAVFGHCMFDHLHAHLKPLESVMDGEVADYAQNELLSSLWKDRDVAYVSVGHDAKTNVVDILPSGKPSRMPSLACPLSHAKFCPSRHVQAGTFGEDPALDETQWVRTGVAFVVYNKDNAVLLTQRAAHMRAFPSVWVVPGGHVDLGETLIEAGVREVYEETGIRIKPGTVQMLCMWESNYPIDATPRRQHLVVYFQGLADDKPEPQSVKVDPTEVARACWVPFEAIRPLAEGAAEGSPVRMPDASHGPAQPTGSEVALEDIAGQLAEGTRFALACFAQG